MSTRESRYDGTVFRHTFTTAFGPVGLHWSTYEGQPRVLRIALDRSGNPGRLRDEAPSPVVKKATCSEVDAVAGQIQAFLQGDDIRFSLDLLRLDLCSRFQRAVLRAEHAIPRGCVSTYGLIGRFLGQPAAARAVGTALATNPFPIAIPCHRAVRSDGSLGGYQGGLAMKRALLEMEGIAFDKAGRIVKGAAVFYAGTPTTDRLDQREGAPWRR